MAERVDLDAVQERTAETRRWIWRQKEAIPSPVVEHLNHDVPDLVAELRIDRRLLERLVGAEPVDDQGCIYCHEGPWPEPAEPDEYPHVAECPWLQAVNEVALVRAVYTIRDIDSLEHGDAP